MENLAGLETPKPSRSQPACTQTLTTSHSSICGVSALGGARPQVPGPGFHRLDFSVFKDIPLNERMRFQFRTEIFNVTNHPNFNAPGFGGNGVVAISGSTISTTLHTSVKSARPATLPMTRGRFSLLCACSARLLF